MDLSEIPDVELITRIEIFFNNEDEEVELEEATWKYVTTFNEDDSIDEQYSVDIIDGVDQEYVEAEEGWVESEHPRGQPDNAGSFVAKDQSVGDLKKKLQEGIEPTKKETEIQTKIDHNVRKRIQDKIDEMGISDKVDFIETQGSYVKGTDLPSKGSDMDIFIVFNESVGEDERKDLGLKIGLATLDKEYADSQGWKDFKVATKEGGNKYAESFFEVNGQTVEVQIVPTRNLDKYDIIKRESNGEKTEIGMERTPHQTKFMNEKLSPVRKKEVRTLKKFMKESGLYDSSIKSQGFSGYSTEVLIYNLGSFDNVVDYFADYKMGDVIGLPDESMIKDLKEHGVDTKDKYTKEFYNTHASYRNNKIHMTDPIDPNRDIGGAISEAKLAKTILTMKHVKEHGRAPDEVEPTNMNGVSLTFNSEISDENVLGSQVQKLQRDIISKLSKLGFEVEHEFDDKIDIVEGLSVNPRRMSIEQEKGSNTMTLNFGLNTLYNDSEDESEIDISKMPDDRVQNMISGMKDKGTKYVEKDGKITTYKSRQYNNVQDAVKGLLEGTSKIELKDSGVLQEIRKQEVNPFTKFSNFENIL